MLTQKTVVFHFLNRIALKLLITGSHVTGRLFPLFARNCAFKYDSVSSHAFNHGKIINGGNEKFRIFELQITVKNFRICKFSL